MRRILVIITTSFLLFSCSYNGPKILPNVSGASGEIIVVIDKTEWNTEVGNALRNTLAVEEPFLPQRESMFSLANVPEANFSKIFQTHRNIVIVEISPSITEPTIGYQENIWAAPQTMVKISGANGAQVAKIIEENGSKLREMFLLAERSRVIENARKYGDSHSLRTTVLDMFGGAPYFPRGYSMKKASNNSNFIWISNEATYTNQGILIYTIPYIDENSLSLNYLMDQRDLVLKDNVPGPSQGSYMITNRTGPQGIKEVVFNNLNFVEVKGLWDVQNDFMGGPFVCLFLLNKENNTIIALDAFVHAPRYDKRDYLRQVESIIYSFEYKSEDNN